MDDLVEQFGAGDALVAPGDLAGAVEVVRERRVEDVVDERRFARPRHAGDDDEVAQRERDVDVLERVLTRSLDDEAATVLTATRLRHRDGQSAAEVTAGDGLLLREQALDRAGVDDLSPVLTGTGPDVDDPVGRRDRVLVVLDDDERVAEVAQARQRLDEAVVVALVKTDRRLVEDVEHADETRADLRREADALRLTTRQRAGGPVEREVVEADVEQEAETRRDLLDDALGDLPLARGEVDVVEEVRGLRDRQRAHLGDRLAADRHRQRLGLEACAVARRAWHLAHVALVALTAPLRLRLRVATLDERDDALEARRIGALTPETVAVGDVNLVVLALEQHRLRLGRQVAPRGVEVEPALLAERAHDADEIVGGTAALRPRQDRALAQRLVLVGDDEVGVDTQLGAETGAGRAGTERAVERERTRLDRVHRQRVVVRAGEPLRVTALERQLVVLVLGALAHDAFDDDEAVREAEGRLDRVGEALAAAEVVRPLRDETVDDDVDRVLLLLLQRRRFAQRHRLTVDTGTGEALRLQFGEQVDVLALAGAHDGCKHLEAGARR